jgi:hypothetical protein
VLDNQVDLGHETWTDTGALISGDCIAAVEGGVRYQPGHARWYGPNLNIDVYSINPAEKTTSLERPLRLRIPLRRAPAPAPSMSQN